MILVKKRYDEGFIYKLYMINTEVARCQNKLNMAKGNTFLLNHHPSLIPPQTNIPGEDNE